MKEVPQKTWMWIRENPTLPERDLKIAKNMSPRKTRKHQGLQISSALKAADTWVPKLDHYHSIFMLVMESHGTCRREKRLKHLDPRCKSPSLRRSHRPLWLFLVEWQIRRTLPTLRRLNDEWERKLNIEIQHTIPERPRTDPGKEDILLELIDQLHLDIVFIQETFRQPFQGSDT